MTPRGDNYRVISDPYAWAIFVAWYEAAFGPAYRARPVLPIRPRGRG